MNRSLLFYVFFTASKLAHCNDSIFWYPSPASDFNSALPIGNGRLGAMVYGLTDVEKISLNEDSIWSGAFTNRVNPQSNQTLPKIRELMDGGNLTEAGNEWLTGLVGIPDEERYYEPAGSLLISTEHNQDQVTDYNRTLDLRTGVAATNYTFGEVSYYRQAVASYPAGVIALRFWASQPGSINCSIVLERLQNVSSIMVDEESILLRGTASNNSAYTFSSGVRILTKSGSAVSNGSAITVSGADEIELFWDAETLYRHSSSATYEQALNSTLAAAAERGFESVVQEAIIDYQSLYSSASLFLGNSSGSSVSDTATRLKSIQSSNSLSKDPELLALAYNFGRYLMISSAREGSLPPNLQGNWNENFSPPWGSRFTIDINLEMNYWFPGVNGLEATEEPLWNLIDKMKQRGELVAREMYNAKGWVCHHNTDLWGDCAPNDAGTQWTIWPMGGAWMLAHVIDHYRFTGNKTFASEIALPLLSDALDFYYNYTVLQDGFYQNYPSLSPENAYIIPSEDGVAGQTTGIAKSTQMDRALLWNLCTGFIELSSAVGSTAGVSQAEDFVNSLEPPTVSSKTGQLLEWDQDYNITEAGHRHFSPLFGLHPGTQYSLLTNSTLGAAALKLLDFRMANDGGSTGWSRIWSSILYSRSFEGDKALESIVTLFSTYMYNNLFSITSDVYQIDANFGMVTAVNEMFLQSNNKMVHLGPAMPSEELTEGNFTGWVARGGFVVNASWTGGHIKSARIVSTVGNELAIRVENGRSFSVDGTPYSQPIGTTAGGIYMVTV